MSPQSLLGVIFALFLVSTWTILKVDALAKVHLDKVCQEMYQNFDRNTRAVDLDILQECIDRWGERLRRAPNDVTLQIQHNRMQTFLRNSMAVDKFQVPMSPQQVNHHVGKFNRVQNPQKCKKLAKAPIPAGDKQLQELNGQLVQCMNRLKSSKQREHDAAQSARLQTEIDLLLDRFNQLEQARINRKRGAGSLGTKLKGPPLIQQARQITAPRPSSSEQVELPNVMAVVQRPARSHATVYEVGQELLKIQKGHHRSTRYKTEYSNCFTLIKSLRASPNPPLPQYIPTHHIIVQDCAKVWEKLRDKAADDLNKQTLLQRELDLMEVRLVQIQIELNRRQSQVKKDDKTKTVIRDCVQLVRNPRNLAVSTMVQKLKYKAELEDCIKKWGQIRGRRQQRIGLNDELVTMRNELDRVKDLISQGQGQGQQNAAAAGPSRLQAKVMRPKVVPQKKPFPRPKMPCQSVAKKNPESHRNRDKGETGK